MRVLQTGNATSRAQATSALSQVPGGPEVEQALLAASRDKESSVAVQAAMALGQLGTPAALARIEELARGSDLQVTRQALTTLTAAPERAAPIARSLSDSDSPEARLLAMEVATSLPSEAATPILLAGINDRDGNVVRAALAQLSVFTGDATMRSALQSVTSNAALPEDVRERAGQLLRSPS